VVAVLRVQGANFRKPTFRVTSLYRFPRRIVHFSTMSLLFLICTGQNIFACLESKIRVGQPQTLGVMNNGLPQSVLASFLGSEVPVWEHHYGYFVVTLLFLIVETILVLALFVELRRRRRAEQALSRSEFRMHDLVQRAPYGITRAGWKQDRFLSANPAAVKMLGYTSEGELCSKSLSRDIYVDTTGREHFLEQLRPGGEYSGKELRWKRKDGKPITVRASGRVIAHPDIPDEYVIEGMIEDVTEQALLQQEFRQAQKMEAVGRLAGGIAHDFNNLLGVILGYGELLDDSLRDNPRAQERVRHITEAATHAATLTAQLLAFSRRQVIKPRILKLNSVVSDAENLLRRLIGEDVELRIELDPTVGEVKADHGQLVQVIMNLAVNARDAMPNGGVLSISTRMSNSAAAQGAEKPAHGNGCFAMLTISDTGCGMTPEVRAHIFEPFFTTKGIDQGTGLGLATVHGIVMQAGGHIEVNSELEKGSSFEIYLPCADVREKKETVFVPHVGATNGSETILIVEDSPQLLELMCECLRALGYTLLTAGNGAAAVDLLRNHNSRIDLMITDVIMPHMSGMELYQRVQQIRPDMKVVFISGYLEDTLSRLKIENAEITLIEKPFQVVEFTRTIREILDKPSSEVKQSA
jgi:two-component system cell cycle sensor histidine kinase/response regulator CckA